MGCVFDIKRYAIHDGPGIRIAIFLKGCPLSCVWCHNPEGISSGPEKMYTVKKCIGCKYCIQACQNHAIRFSPEGINTDKATCISCGKCAGICPALAVEMSGEEKSIDEVMQEIRKETLLMDQSGGGVTFCGGEPLMQKNFLLSLLKSCEEEGIHRVVDTTLYASTSIVEEIIPHTDMFLIDLKVMDSTLHQKYCGVPNEPILRNIRLVAEAGKPFHIRIPLIKGINSIRENITSTADFLASLPWKEKKIELLPYHDIGKNKHEKLGTEYNPSHFTMESPNEEEKNAFIKIFLKKGLHAVVL